MWSLSNSPAWAIVVLTFMLLFLHTSYYDTNMDIHKTAGNASLIDLFLLLTPSMKVDQTA
jgi:hypothetical protein